MIFFVDKIHKNQIITKIADTPDEFNQIHQLNYEVFVEEIRQYSEEEFPSKILIDKFHHENTYIIATFKGKVIGMVVYRVARPFSLDLKIDNLDKYLPQSFYPCECRLLAIKKEYRRSHIIINLINQLIEHAFDQGHNGVIISAITTQLSLYQKVGFIPFSSLLKAGDAYFQPMYIDLLNLTYKHSAQKHSKINASFLPGPVQSFIGVDDVYAEQNISHRSDEFKNLFTETQKSLAQFVNAKYVQIAMGGGTFANDMIAGQLQLLSQKGLILSNGEFGDRLIQHALRANLDFQIYKKEWGKLFSSKEIISILTECSDIQWIWGVHCETSTGMLNDIDSLINMAEKFKIKLILDCVSSLGTVPLDLSKLYLASGSSAKGLGAKTGLAFVFHNHSVESQPNKLPASLDLGNYLTKNGIPYTLSSSLIKSLYTALKWFNNPNIWFRTKQISSLIRKKFEEENISLLVEEQFSSPAIITVKLNEAMDSTSVGKALAKRGIFTHYSNTYLQENNWLQIALMGRFFYKDIRHLLNNISLFKEA